MHIDLYVSLSIFSDAYSQLSLHRIIADKSKEEGEGR